VAVGDGGGVALGGGKVGVETAVGLAVGSTSVGINVSVGLGSFLGLQPKSTPTTNQTKDHFHALKARSSRGH
jgi:hypothetical protein